MTIRTTREQKRAQWQGVIDQFGISGLKPLEFCRKNRIKLSVLQYWLKKNVPTPVDPELANSFVEVKSIRPESTIAMQRLDICEIALPTGMRLSFNGSMDVKRLAQIIQALREIPC